MFVVKLTTKDGSWYLRAAESGALLLFDTVDAAWRAANEYDGPANVSIEPYDPRMGW